MLLSELVFHSTILHMSRSEDKSLGMGTEAISNPEEKKAAILAKKKNKKSAIDYITDPKLKEAAEVAKRKKSNDNLKAFRARKKKRAIDDISDP